MALRDKRLKENFVRLMRLEALHHHTLLPSVRQSLFRNSKNKLIHLNEHTGKISQFELYDFTVYRDLN